MPEQSNQAGRFIGQMCLSDKIFLADLSANHSQKVNVKQTEEKKDYKLLDTDKHEENEGYKMLNTAR